MERTARGEMLMRRVRRDVNMWLTHGIGISRWSVNEDTGNLEIGVRTPTEQDAGPLRRAYGPETHVYYANITPGGGAVTR